MMKENFYKGAARGAFIGLFGGLFTGGATLLVLFVYWLAWPDEHLGSTAALAPVTAGFWWTVFGVILGGILGAVAGMAGFDVNGPLRGILFGAILMEAIGLLGLVGSIQDAPERTSRSIILLVGLTVVSSGLSGALGGALVGAFSRVHDRTSRKWMSMTDASQRRQARIWVVAVLALGLPSIALVLSHVILDRLRPQLPEWLDLVLAWTGTVTWLFGGFTTAGAVLVAIGGSYLPGVPGRHKALMWAFATVSLLALVYLAQLHP